jgi:hypothetical protein
MSPGFDEAAGFSALYDATHVDLLAFLRRRNRLFAGGARIGYAEELDGR